MIVVGKETMLKLSTNHVSSVTVLCTCANTVRTVSSNGRLFQCVLSGNIILNDVDNVPYM